MSKALQAAITLAAVAAMTCVGFGANALANSPHRDASPKLKGKIAFLVPEEFTGRWVIDSKFFKSGLAKFHVPSSDILEYNANGVQGTQTTQAKDALAAGAKVLVLSPVDSKESVPIVQDAVKQHAVVIAYDRMIESKQIFAYDSFNAILVGELQGKWIKSHVKKGGTIVMINGSSTDANGVMFAQGAHKILDPLFKKHTLKLGYEAYTLNWDDPTAGNEMKAALAKLHDKVNGVLVANDAMGANVSAALQAVHLAKKIGLTMTGQDGEWDGLGRILTGYQGMDVYKPLNDEAGSSAKAAYYLDTGQIAKAKAIFTTKTKNTTGASIRSIIFKPTVLRYNNINAPIKQGLWTWSEVCTPLHLPAKPWCGKKHPIKSNP